MKNYIKVVIWFVRWHLRQSKNQEDIEEDPTYNPKEIVSASSIHTGTNTFFFPRLDSISDVFTGEVRKSSQILHA